MANLRTNKLVGIGSTDAGVVFDGDIVINTPNVMYFPTGISSERGRGRGLNGGGNTGSLTDRIDYLQIQSDGITQDFGNLNEAKHYLA